MRLAFGHIVHRADAGNLVIVGRTREGKYLAAPYRKGGNLDDAPTGTILGKPGGWIVMIVPSQEHVGRALEVSINRLVELTDEEIEVHEADYHAVDVYHEVATKRDAPDTNWGRMRYMPVDTD